MTACVRAEPVVIGDSVSLAFLVKDASGDIMDITGIVFSGEISDSGGGTILSFSQADRLVVEDVIPDTEADPDDQEPHGVVNLSSADTALLAEGALQWLIIRMAFSGQTDTMRPRLLRGIIV